MENTTTRGKIPTEFLPEDWREQGAAKFACSKNKVERIVYGLVEITIKNQEIFDFMLSMAEAGKTAAETKQKEFNERLKKLTEVL